MTTRTMEPETAAAPAPQTRALAPQAFRRVFDEEVVHSGFFEGPKYYQRYWDRYWNTLREVATLDLPRPARVLDVGAGIFALLAHRLWQDDCAVADISSEYAEAVTRYGIPHAVFDLARDEPPEHLGRFDLILLCEVIEHIPLPPHVVLDKLLRLLRPGGYILLTTPNLGRPRNVWRLAVHGTLFTQWRIPDPPAPLGHIREYTAAEMEWHLRQAGFTDCRAEITQLTNGASSPAAHVFRWATLPLRLRKQWRDAVIAVARRPEEPARPPA